MKAILIVDALATGEDLFKYCKGKKYNVYHYFTTREYFASFSPQAEGYAFFHAIFEKANNLPFDQTFSIFPNQQDAVNTFAKLKLDAILPGTDRECVVIANQLAYQLGLPCNEQAKLRGLVDKNVMQDLLVASNVRSIKKILTSSPEETIQWFKKNNNNKIVIKPLSVGGTIGVRVCDSQEKILSYFNEFGTKEQYIVEEFIEGWEYAVNTVSTHGHHRLEHIFIYHKIEINGAPVHDISFLVNDDGSIDPTIKAVKAYAFQVLDALGVKFGAGHLEIKMTKTGPVLIEMGARAMGSMACSGESFSKALGYDVFANIINSYINPNLIEKETIDFKKFKPFIIKHFISYVNANVSNFHTDELMVNFPSFSQFLFDGIELSKQLVVTKDFQTKPGHVLLVHDDVNQVFIDYYLLRLADEYFINVFFTYQDLSKEDNKYLALLKKPKDSEFINNLLKKLQEIDQKDLYPIDNIQQKIILVNTFVKQYEKK